MDVDQDAYGQELYDYYWGNEDVREIVERDDGYIAISAGPPAYFAPYAEWPAHQQAAMQYVNGRVLDVGCGAGRVSLYLQERGHEVVGIDNSPLAIDVCRRRGLEDARILSVTQASRQKLGTFDTIVMMGNNFGLFGNLRRAQWLLRRFHNMTSAGGRIVAESRDPYGANEPAHLAYHEFNRNRGRLPGQIRIRIRYKKTQSPWFDYLLVSPEEMKAILAGTGWQATRFISAEEAGTYVAVIEKTA